MCSAPYSTSSWVYTLQIYLPTVYDPSWHCWAKLCIHWSCHSTIMDAQAYGSKTLTVYLNYVCFYVKDIIIDLTIRLQRLNKAKKT